MTPFHVGMKVVCVDEQCWRGCGYGIECLPVKGNVYTIHEMVPSQDRIGRLALRFHEIRNEPRTYRAGHELAILECAFIDTAFRPVHETRMEELRSLLLPTPAKQKERV